MKSIFKKLSVILLLITMIISATACGEDDSPNVTHKELGLTFTLPKTMIKKNVEYADLCYFDGKVEFFVSVFHRDKLASNEEGGLNLNPNISVDDYAERFIFWNEYEVEFQFDEELNIATFFADAPAEYGDSYYHVITRNDDYLYVVIICCDTELMEGYKDTFIEWGKTISAK